MNEIVSKIEDDGHVACEMKSLGKRAYESHIIADSIYSGERITTMAVRFPRFILPEINTHRVFSRNSASSRARSLKVTIREVMENPFVPDPFTGDKKGMQGDNGENLNQRECSDEWLMLRDNAVATVLSLRTGRHVSVEDLSDWEDILDQPYASSVHKQHANRLLEPFMWHTALITCDNWDNFLDLRISEYAQPEICKTAETMKYVMEMNDPVETSVHLPFVDIDPIMIRSDLDVNEMMRLVPISVARCARVSYKLYTGQDSSPDKDTELAKRLFLSKHMSPFEHIAFKGEAYSEAMMVFGIHKEDAGCLHGNFSHWYQLRKFLREDKMKPEDTLFRLHNGLDCGE